MNYIFISPNFPDCYWQFCNRLKRREENILGIGEAAYDELTQELKDSLTEYYKVDNLANYNDLYRAVAYFAFRYGKIDYIDSMNEFWLVSDARLREDFNVCTGVKGDSIYRYIRKSLMHQLYAEENLPTAPQITVTTLRKAQEFVAKVGLPVVVKPDIGVGAADTWKIEDEEGLKSFFDNKPKVPYVMEKFLGGRIAAYNAVIDTNGDVVFEQFMDCDPIMDTVVNDGDIAYCTIPDVPQAVHILGTKVIKGLHAMAGFAHIEFICLDRNYEGIGKKGEYALLEHNMRPPGGFTLDMMNFSGNCDVYDIYAGIVTGKKSDSVPYDKKYFCAYVGRKQRFSYLLSREELLEEYGKAVKIYRQLEPSDWKAMGQNMYIAKFRSMKKATGFINTALSKQEES